MERAQVQSVALFYFLSLLDERQALRATFKTLEEIKKRKSQLKGGEKLSNSTFVELTNKNWIAKRKFLPSPNSTSPHVEGWIAPAGLDLGPWRQFRKQSPATELLAVIWSRILGFSDQDLAEGLSISKGTIQYRVSNGLKLLGTMTPLGSARG